MPAGALRRCALAQAGTSGVRAVPDNRLWTQSSLGLGFLGGLGLLGLLGGFPCPQFFCAFVQPGVAEPSLVAEVASSAIVALEKPASNNSRGNAASVCFSDFIGLLSCCNTSLLQNGAMPCQAARSCLLIARSRRLLLRLKRSVVDKT